MRFNTMLDDAAREQHAASIALLHRVAPDVIARKIERANIQQGWMVAAVESLTGADRSKRLLSVGCFEDTAYVALKALGYTVVGIDPMIDTDVATYRRHNPALEGFFDIVFSTSVIEHVVDDEAFVRDMAALTKLGGFLILTCDFADNWRPTDPKPSSDIRIYNRHDMDRLLAAVPDCSLVDDPDWMDHVPDFIIEEFGVIMTYGFATLTLCRDDIQVKPYSRPVVMLVSHSTQQCGVHEFGINIANALRHSLRYDFRYVEPADPLRLVDEIARFDPAVVVFNFHPATLPWAPTAAMFACARPTIAILHDVQSASADTMVDTPFDLLLVHELGLQTTNPQVVLAPRPIPSMKQTRPVTYVDDLSPGRIISVGSFGFPSEDKHFEQVVQLAQDSFERCEIRLHLPNNDLNEQSRETAMHIVEQCRARIRRPGVELTVSHEFLRRDDLLTWVARNDINVLLYAPDRGLGGISSAADIALASGKPLALRRGKMFRNFEEVKPSIFVDDRPLHEILAAGTAPLEPLRQAWSGAQLAAAWEAAVDRLVDEPNLLRPDGDGPLLLVNIAKEEDAELNSVQLAATFLEPMSTVTVRSVPQLVAATRLSKPRAVLLDARSGVPDWLTWTAVARVRSPMIAVVETKNHPSDLRAFMHIESASALRQPGGLVAAVQTATRLAGSNELHLVDRARILATVASVAVKHQAQADKMFHDELSGRLSDIWRAADAFQKSAASWKARAETLEQQVAAPSSAQLIGQPVRRWWTGR